MGKHNNPLPPGTRGHSADDGASSEVPSVHTEEESKEDTLNMSKVKKCITDMNKKLKKARDKVMEEYKSRLEEIQDVLDRMLEHFGNHVKDLNQNATAFAESLGEWNPPPE